MKTSPSFQETVYVMKDLLTEQGDSAWKPWKTAAWRCILESSPEYSKPRNRVKKEREGGGPTCSSSSRQPQSLCSSALVSVTGPCPSPYPCRMAETASARRRVDSRHQGAWLKEDALQTPHFFCSSPPENLTGKTHFSGSP